MNATQHRNKSQSKPKPPAWYEANPALAMCMCYHSRSKHPGDGQCRGFAEYFNHRERCWCKGYLRSSLADPEIPEVAIERDSQQHRWMIVAGHVRTPIPVFTDRTPSKNVVNYLVAKANGPICVQIR